MPPKGSKKSGGNPPPTWWRALVLDEYVRAGKPSSYRGDDFHKRCKGLIKAAYEGVLNAPEVCEMIWDAVGALWCSKDSFIACLQVEGHDGCSNLGEKFVKSIKDLKPSEINGMIQQWAMLECHPIGVCWRPLHVSVQCTLCH